MKINIGKSYLMCDTDVCNETEMVIENVFVPKEERKKGIARKLVSRAIEYARKKGYKTVGLCAEPQEDCQMSGEQLIEFYKSMGFVSHGDVSELMYMKL